MADASVVLLPAPVAPLTTTRPLGGGLLIRFWNPIARPSSYIVGNLDGIFLNVTVGADSPVEVVSSSRCSRKVSPSIRVAQSNAFSGYSLNFLRGPTGV